MFAEHIRRADIQHEEFKLGQKAIEKNQRNIERNQLEIRDLRKDWREMQC